MTTSDDTNNRQPSDLRPQYRLRTMFWVVTCLCVLFTVMATLGAVWSAALLMLLLLVAAHVAGNAIGTSLRDRAVTERRESNEPPPKVLRPRIRSDSPPANRLQDKQPLERLMLLVAILGGLVGAVFGGVLVTDAYRDRITVAAVVFGTIASGVIGALVGFVVASSFGITARAWQDMWREHKKKK